MILKPMGSLNQGFKYSGFDCRGNQPFFFFFTQSQNESDPPQELKQMFKQTTQVYTKKKNERDANAVNNEVCV